MNTIHKKLLTTSSLTVGYRKRNESENILFKNLDLELTAGQLVCFMGRNGAGKSSLIRTLAGLQQPLSGQINFPGGYDIPRQVSVVLTDKPSVGNMSAQEIVRYGRYPYLNWTLSISGRDEEIVKESMQKVGIQSLAEKSINELSDGQLQMVMIARAIAQDTPIILLDEPTAHLDLNNRVEVMKLLQTLTRKMNKAILVSTHEIDLALQTGDVIWLTGKDHDIQAGLPEDLVLDGSFDRIFEFEGYDLKSGKIHHEAHRGKEVQLSGEGYHFLWTKNALERCGFTVTKNPSELRVVIEIEESRPRWILLKNNRQYITHSIAALIEHI